MDLNQGNHMKIFQTNRYLDKRKTDSYRVFFQPPITFKFNGRVLYKSDVPCSYYTNELTKVNPYEVITNV